MSEREARQVLAENERRRQQRVREADLLSAPKGAELEDLASSGAAEGGTASCAALLVAESSAPALVSPAAPCRHPLEQQQTSRLQQSPLPSHVAISLVVGLTVPTVPAPPPHPPQPTRQRMTTRWCSSCWAAPKRLWPAATAARHPRSGGAGRPRRLPLQRVTCRSCLPGSWTSGGRQTRGTTPSRVAMWSTPEQHTDCYAHRTSCHVHVVMSEPACSSCCVPRLCADTYPVFPAHTFFSMLPQPPVRTMRLRRRAAGGAPSVCQWSAYRTVTSLGRKCMQGMHA